MYSTTSRIFLIKMVDLVAIGAKTPKIDSGYSLKNEFIKLICMNP